VSRPPVWRTLLLVGLALVSVVALVATGVLVPKISAASSRDDRRTEVLQAARQQAVNFTTLDYRHLDRDLGRVLDGSTGDFRKQFRSGTKDLTQLVTANKAVSTGTVLSAGLVSSDADSARVLVVADSTVVNTGSPKGEKRHYRIQMDLVRHPGGSGRSAWLVSDLTFVG
jgi:Mce-associated membrane protein